VIYKRSTCSSLPYNSLMVTFFGGRVYSSHAATVVMGWYRP